ncbi:PilZ domain-containing protein [Pseudobutyrivibrio sp. YE44]|uniref:PilZ domain-containing protein n=1 Tax=Pseudobutyrivibrio sp. YE44 TaxID=1520802 RepID=UPI0015A2E2B2|nr:PilZ domain-containing protein [Pseudobutyrivibrio sp. YE44]
MLGKKKIELPAEYASLSEAEHKELFDKYGTRVVPIENILTHLQEKIVEVSFKGNHLSDTELLAVTSVGVFRWKNVKIFKVTLTTGKVIHIIFSAREDGEKFNRRRGVRLNLDKQMDIELNGERFKAVVRDISYCGMSFVKPEGLEIEPGMPIVLHLSELADDEDDRVVGAFEGKVLNKRIISSGAEVCGCVISAEHAAFLQRYIAIKQMERASGKRSEKTLTKVKTGEYWQNDLAEVLNESIT